MASILITAITAWIALRIAWSIVHPIERVATAADALSKGDFNGSDLSAMAKRQDELGRVSASFTNLHQTIDSLSEELGAVQGAIRDGENEIRTRTDLFEGRWLELAKDMNSALDRFNEVSEGRQEAERVVQESQRRSLLGRMAGGMAHDFNNLLAVMIGFSEIAEETCSDPEPLREIRKAGMKARDLVARLMAVGRKSELDLSVMSFETLLSEAEQSIRSILPETIGLDFTVQQDSWINTDETSFNQILLNLVVNARDAMPDGGKLTVESGLFRNPGVKTSLGESTNEGEYWYIRIGDEGTGIPEETRKRIFEPFYTTKSVDKGTGLGLAMVYGLMQQFGGWVDVDSEVGKGSSFFLFFPVVEAPEGAEVAKEEEQSVSESGEKAGVTGLNVFLAEDNPALRRMIVKGLEKMGAMRWASITDQTW
ncbi:MAG: ATP-binding protein, partial [Verrucomicrobiota bacterium]